MTPAKSPWIRISRLHFCHNVDRTWNETALKEANERPGNVEAGAVRDPRLAPCFFTSVSTVHCRAMSFGGNEDIQTIPHKNIMVGKTLLKPSLFVIICTGNSAARKQTS